LRESGGEEVPSFFCFLHRKFHHEDISQTPEKENPMKTRSLATALIIAMGASFSARATGTDDQIETAAKNSYTFKHYLKHDDVKVHSKDGSVMLTGSVKWGSHKMLAEETVAELPGVTGVDNEIKVKGTEPAENSDAWIFTKVKTMLLFHSNVTAKTDVTVKDGIVTLRGKADNAAERDLTTEYVKDVEGVKDVHNNMTVTGSTDTTMRKIGQNIDDATITAEVKMTLWDHSSTSATGTKVTTNGGVVTLTGHADNAAEKDLATELVSHIDGVKNVVNNMTY
jgi:osmotically-inducible protein OsmY